MNEDQKLRDQLLRPTPPGDLESRIRDNWRQQLSQQELSHQQPLRWRAMAASITVFIISAFLMVTFSTTPKLVVAAIDDIKKDKQFNVGLIISPADWIAGYHVNMPPPAMAINMSKYCLISGNETTHLEIAGVNQGQVHLFIKKGEFDIGFWQKHKGRIASMPWQLITPRKDLSVLVLHTADINPANVKKLIQTMFYV